MVGMDTFNGFSQLGFCVLDDMTFVENTIMPLDSLQIVDVVANYLVGGDHKVILGKFWEQTGAVAGVASVHDGPQVLGILENFIVPVAGQCRRTDDQ